MKITSSETQNKQQENTTNKLDRANKKRRQKCESRSNTQSRREGRSLNHLQLLEGLRVADGVMFVVSLDRLLHSLGILLVVDEFVNCLHFEAFAGEDALGHLVELVRETGSKKVHFSSYTTRTKKKGEESNRCPGSP